MPGSFIPASLLNVGLAPSAAMAMTYVAAAQSIGLAMENAVSAQQRGQVVGEATLVQILAIIIAKGVKGK